MSETIGTLSLKIAQLERQLLILKQQHALSYRYPTHQNKLTLASIQVQDQLGQLMKRRQDLSRATPMFKQEVINGDNQRERSF